MREIAKVYDISADEFLTFRDVLQSNGFRIYPGMHRETIRSDFSNPVPGEMEVFHGGRRLWIYSGERGKVLQDVADRYMSGQKISATSHEQVEESSPILQPIAVNNE